MVEEKIRKLIEEELARANSQFGLFNSAHQGWAVLKEEIEESKEELTSIEKMLDATWVNIREEHRHNQLHYVSRMKGYAECLIAEAVQVAAMARKFYEYIEKSNGR